MKYFLSIVLLLILMGCNTENDLDDIRIDQEFADHWFAGNAEVVSYDLVQSRYGEPRDGHAVLIFVTEPFSKSHHVKLDDPEKAGSDAATVMKLNMIKKFVTGIYPYSMMLSVFTPADTETPRHPFKITMSGQEWCGQVYSQMNRKQNNYRFQGFSYFQSEGDMDSNLPGEWLEDEIWNLIRMNPEKLPVGKIKIYPGLFYTRLNHKPMEAGFADAQLSDLNGEKIYRINFSSGRSFEWHFTPEFPHVINSWREENTGRDGSLQVTTATLRKSLFLPYWKFNGTEDIILRDSLGIR